ncbi:MAG: SDR family NAD(P)-dependent oxidoreductase, partial [Planctomycetaceae bacterium]
MDLGLNNKIAIVTGGSKGIGLGIVCLLLNEGAKVVNVSRSPADSLPPTATPDRYLFVQGDLSSTDTCAIAVQQTVQHFHGIDILVNNAGVNDG